MFTQALTTTIGTLCLSVSVGVANETVVANLAHLKRLAQATDHLKLPESTGIRTWRQTSETTGTSAVVDADEQLLSHIVNLWNDRCANMDLEHVAVLSETGRQVRFVNYRKVMAGEQQDVLLRGGDIVVFLLPDGTSSP